MKYVSLLLVTLFLCSCEVNSYEEFDVEEQTGQFLDSKELDSRTTFLTVSQDENVIHGLAESENLKNEFWSAISKDHPKLIDSIQVVTNPQRAVIRNSVANARDDSRHSAQLVTQYLMGQEVKVFDKDGGWYYVQGPDNYLGWIDAGGLAIGNQISQEWEEAEKVTVETNETTAYEPESTSQVATDLVFGNVLGKLSGNKYILPDGRKVTIQNNDIFTPPTDTNKVQLVLEKANSLLGRPYLWGGTSTKGMDCSGFTRMAFMNAGYMLGRDASLQVNEGTKIDKDDISQWKPGDLLFFGSIRDDGSMRVTHVAIHEGDGRLIHSSQRVRKESLNPDHEDYNENRRESLLAVRRIFRK